MKQSISSPSSSSYFHVGTSVPYFYQDFIARFSNLKGEKCKQIMATNSVGLRNFKSKEFFKTITRMALKWDGETISDTDVSFNYELKNYIKKLIDGRYIKKDRVEVFVCKNHPQIYLTPGENNYLKLVKKEKSKVSSFYVKDIGEISIWKNDTNLTISYIGVSLSYHGPRQVHTPYGDLNVKRIRYLKEPIVFFEEKDDLKKLKKIPVKSFKMQYVYKCSFCNETLTPMSQTAWVMRYPHEFNRDILKGVTQRKQWDTLANEIETRQIITRKRGEPGVKTKSISPSLGINNGILDPEFCIQFLPIFVTFHSKKPIDTFIISNVNHKFILNSLRLYYIFKRPIINNILVVGILMGNDHQTMRKSNNNAVGLNGLINKYGVDAVRLYIANANLLIKDSRVFEESSLKGYKRFINRILLKFQDAKLVEHINSKESYLLFFKEIDFEVKKLNFAHAVEALIKFFSHLQPNIPTSKKDFYFFKKAIQYLECFCPETAEKLYSIINIKKKGI